jgi:circadian clock protein KaiC
VFISSSELNLRDIKMGMEYSNKEYLSTGVAGLDDVLAGGFPTNHIYLVEGNPGSGKTTLALQFLLAGAESNEKCLYVTLSESADELKSVARSHGWDLSKIEIFELAVEKQLTSEDQNTFFHTAEVELGATNDAILEKMQEVKPTRVVIDSMTELKLMAQSPIKFRRQILAFKQYFARQNATVLLLDDKTSAISDQEVQSIVHGIVKLEQMSPEYGAERRRVNVTKMRGVSFRGGYHDFTIRRGGLAVFPRLIASEHGVVIGKDPLKSGISEVDRLMCGGIQRGSSTLIMGPAGSGKSTLSLQYAIAAAERGENAAVFTFDEGIHTIIARTKGMGLDIEKLIQSGKLKIQQIDPAELSPGEFASTIRKTVDADGTKVVVIDSLNGYLNAMPEERFLVIQMHEILSYLSQMGVCTFLIVVQHGILGASMDSNVEISYLSDNVFLLRYFEDFGQVKQALSVVKKRAGPHEKTIRQFSLTENGLIVGPPITQFQAVLSGVPQMSRPHNDENGELMQ